MTTCHGDSAVVALSCHRPNCPGFVNKPTQVYDVAVLEKGVNPPADADRKLGLRFSETSELKVALEEDEKSALKPKFGERTLTWMKTPEDSP